MSWLDTLLWSFITLFGLAGSALYSGMETGAYRVNRVRLQVLSDRGHAAASRLQPMIQKPALLLSVLLVGNNLMNNLGTSGLGVLLNGFGFSDTAVILFTVAVITPTLFVFGEVLPKDLFSAYADRLMYRLAWVLPASRWCYTALLLLPVVQGLSWLVMRMFHAKEAMTHFHPRRQVSLLLKEGVGHGLLSDEQSVIVERVLSLYRRTVRDEMMPWPEVITLSVEDPPQRIWALADETSHSRFPVVDAQGHVQGVVELLDALRSSEEQTPPIRELIRPILHLPPDMPLRTALPHLQGAEHAIALVGDPHQPQGVVTVKDLVEPITGELSSW